MTCAMSSTARPNASSFAFDGFVEPLTLRTYWSAAARISSSVAGGSKLWSVLMFRHMADTLPATSLAGILHALHALWLYARMVVPKAIQIRNVPDDVHAVLRARAAAAGMSMSEYLRSELITMAATPTLDEWLDRVAAQPPSGVSTQEIVDAIREMRGPIPPEE